MRNQLYYIAEGELNFVKQQVNTRDNIWIVEIDGNDILTWEDYAIKMEKAFQFPTPCDKSMDAYIDWMTDLSWLNVSGYVLFIKNYQSFMKDDIEKKEKVIWFFKEDILPFWESGITQYVVNGIAKPFNVYLVV